MKTLVGSLALLISSVSVFAATDLSQELDSKGGTLKVNDSLTINYEQDTFNETVILSARTVSQLDGDISDSKIESKDAEILFISIKNNIGLTAELQKPISFAYNNLNSFDNPVLVTIDAGEVIEIQGKDMGWTMIYTLENEIEGVYTIMNDLDPDTSSAGESKNDDSQGLFEESEPELNAAPEKNDDEMKQTSVILADKPTKGAEDYLTIIFLAIFSLISIGGYYIHKKS